MPREVAQRQIASAKDAVEKLAEQKRVSVKDAIRELYDHVERAITQSGREATEVYAAVAEKLKISDETVKAYYNDIRREKVTSLSAHAAKNAGKNAGGKRA